MIYYLLFGFVAQLLVTTDSTPADSLYTLDPSKMYLYAVYYHLYWWYTIILGFWFQL